MGLHRTTTMHETSTPPFPIVAWLKCERKGEVKGGRLWDPGNGRTGIESSSEKLIPGIS